jgi:imidazolonepropionase
MSSSTEAKTKQAVDLIVHPIGELASSLASSEPLHGSEMSNILRIKDAALAIAGDKIVHCGEAQEVLSQVELKPDGKTIDAGGKVVVPRCQGRSYQEIARAGGGIVASMNATRHATVDELVSLGEKRLAKLLAHGTTTCEVKTGYGLSAESELNMMKAIFRLSKMQPVDLIPTFMPAHAFPPGSDHNEYIRSIKHYMLPALANLVKEEGRQATEVYQDVFCDEGYFTLEQSREILQEGSKFGFRPKVHADEFVNLGASALAVELGASSADHLLNISDNEMHLMAESDTVAVLLPGTSFFLNLKEHAAARAMIDHGVAVAIGSDFNPGSCHIFSMPFIIGLSCLHLGMTISEAFCAATVNAAFAVGKGQSLGQLKADYQADFLVLDIGSLEELPYNMTVNPVSMVFKRGKQVV